MELNGQIAVITGVSKGIGRSVALQLLAAGCKVYGLGRNRPDMDHPEFSFMACDVRRLEEVESCFAKIFKAEGNRVDILINNAGISMRTLLIDAELEVFKKVMDINYFGTVYCTKLALPSIISRQGTIVGVSSIAGYRGLPGRSGYSASKFAVNGWLEAIRTELMDDGVNVMWVCPGFTRSNIRNAALNEKSVSQGESPMNESQLMSAEDCASHIAKAIEKRKRTLVLTFKGKQTVFMNKFFPAWTDKLTKNFFFKNGKLVK
jgi:short-subunit dehydrogenase